MPPSQLEGSFHRVSLIDLEVVNKVFETTVGGIRPRVLVCLLHVHRFLIRC